MAKLAEPYKNKKKKKVAKRVGETFSTVTAQTSYCSLKAIYYYKLPKNPCLAEIKDYR